MNLIDQEGKKTIGEFLKKRRIKKELSQVELGRELGCFPQHVNNWESGFCLPPKNIYGSLVFALDLTVDEFLEPFIKETRRYLKEALGL